MSFYSTFLSFRFSFALTSVILQDRFTPLLLLFSSLPGRSLFLLWLSLSLLLDARRSHACFHVCSSVLSYGDFHLSGSSLDTYCFYQNFLSCSLLFLEQFMLFWSRPSFTIDIVGCRFCYPRRQITKFYPKQSVITVKTNQIVPGLEVYQTFDRIVEGESKCILSGPIWKYSCVSRVAITFQSP